MIRFSLLGSGSSGNAMFVASPDFAMLIDNGLSFRQLCLRMAELKLDVEGLKAVFLTHEHGDHVNGVGTLARKLKLPVFMTRKTHERLPKSVGEIPNVVFFEAGDKMPLDGLSIQSFSVSHDAVDPVNFVVRSGQSQVGMASDLGHVDNLVRTRLKGSQALVLESNYCPDMLQESTYPPAIIQRIHGRQGHLSNHDMNALLKDLLHDTLELVVLMHVSQQNNTEELALSRASKVLEGHRANLVLAQQDKPTPLFEIAA